MYFIRYLDKIFAVSIIVFAHNFDFILSKQKEEI